MPRSVGATIRDAWDRLSKVPGGKRIFSRVIGFKAPYTGSIRAHVVELSPGYARVQLPDRRGVRNHLQSIHAIALVNLAEMSTGLAMTGGLPEGARGILTGISIEYLKKARGTITAACRTEIPDTPQRQEFQVEGVLTDEAGDVVARATARWLVGPA